MTFKSDMSEFRAHVREMRKMGYIHVSVKYGSKEYHCEGTQEEKHPAVGGGIGFQMEDDE